jgi:integrase
MRLFKRGAVYWYEFRFQNQRFRETTKSANKEAAERIAQERRRKLELGRAGLEKVKKPLLFSVAARQWFDEKKADWSPNSQRIEEYNLNHLLPHFGKLLLREITPATINLYKGKRTGEKASPKTINLELATLRSILRKHRLWANLQPDVQMLKVRGDVGRALSKDEQDRLLTACRNNRSRSLHVAVLLSLHTGLRSSELRHLRWQQINWIKGQLIVGKSKTVGGEGRVIPLSGDAGVCLQRWRSQFPDARATDFVFPSERYGLIGEGENGHFGGKVAPYNVRPTVPIGSWKTAWKAAQDAAGVRCRWHDMRHSFVSTLAESQASDATIMSLAGHLSRKMLEKYSHTSNEAKRAAISVLNRTPQKPNSNHEEPFDSPQKRPQ